MNEIENKTNCEADDEISLIDLFSVLIRHRMLVFVGTAVVFVLAVFELFIVPLVFPKSMKREISVQYNLNIISVPGTIAGQLPGRVSNLKSVVIGEFSDPVFLVKELKKINPYALDKEVDITDEEFNRYTQELLEDKKITFAAAPIRDEVIVTLKIPQNNLKLATTFIDNMVASVNASIEGVFLSEVEKLKKTRQDTYNEILKVYTDNSNLSDAQSLMLTVRLIDDFLQDYDLIAEREVEPFVIVEPLGRFKKLVIATFAAFFVFIFIAFLINAVNNIKQDPEASGKIKSAWDGGKFNRKK